MKYFNLVRSVVFSTPSFAKCFCQALPITYKLKEVWVIQIKNIFDIDFYI